MAIVSDIVTVGTAAATLVPASGETFQLDMRGGESIQAVANRDVQVAVWNED